MQTSTLYIVATPIGNLQDISHRAVATLASVHGILAEDTRHTGKLLSHLNVSTPMVPLHDHNESGMVEGVINRLRNGEALALVSDAGTPLISDPGYRLVKAARQEGFQVLSVPGPSAVMAALSICGLPTDRFCFEGFLPQRPAARRAALEKLVDETRTLVFFESSHRVLASLSDMKLIFGDERMASMCREMTKQFETVLHGTLAHIHQQVELDANQQKGEFVLITRGAGETQPNLTRALELARALSEELPASKAARIAANFTGAARREIYEALSGEKPK